MCITLLLVAVYHLHSLYCPIRTDLQPVRFNAVLGWFLLLWWSRWCRLNKEIMLVEEIVWPKNVNVLSVYRSQTIQCVDEFVSLWKLIWRYVALRQLLTIDPLQWMGAVRMRTQTADKNITIIHITPVHQLMSCEVKNWGYFNIKLAPSGQNMSP